MTRGRVRHIDRVVLQVIGLRMGHGLPRITTRRAVTRDVWPGLLRCVTSLPVPRGHATVRVERGPGVGSVHFAGGALASETPLRRCIQRAFARLVLPPTERSAADAHVTLDLLFDLPPAWHRGHAAQRSAVHRSGRAPGENVAHAELVELPCGW
jgi:hypothetical protein